MAQQFLHSPDVVTIFKKMRGKAVAQRVTTRGFAETAFRYCLLNSLLQDPFANVVSVNLFRARIAAALCRWEDKLPPPFCVGLGIFLGKGVGQVDSAEPFAQIPSMNDCVAAVKRC